MPVSFTCPTCGSVLRAASRKSGAIVACPKCKGELVVPDIPSGNLPAKSDPGFDFDTTALAVRDSISESGTEAGFGDVPPPPSPWRDPARLMLTTLTVFGIAVTLVLISLIFLVAQSRGFAVFLIATVLFALVAAVAGIVLVQLLTAKNRAITRKEVPIFFGAGRIVVWEQNEGLIFLRDKRVFEIIDGRVVGGGLRVIYPILGEERRARVPLTLQLITYQDDRVLTEEAIQLKVKVAIWWQVQTLGVYFYKLDREVHSLRDSNVSGPERIDRAVHVGTGKRTTAEVWLQTLAESCLRKLIASTSTLRIVSNRTWAALHAELGQVPTGPNAGSRAGLADDLPASPERLAEALLKDLQPRLVDYGLSIERVEIQEIQLPTAIQKAVDDVWVAATYPKKSGYEAQALENRLKVLCEHLGQNGAVMSEVVGKLPSGAYMGSPFMALRSLITQVEHGVAEAPPARLPVAKSVPDRKPAVRPETDP